MKLNMRPGKVFWTLALMAGMVIKMGCQSESQTGSGSSMTIRVTDAPFPFDTVTSAKVTIEKVELHSTDKDTEDFITVVDGNTTLDLVNLRNGVTQTLANIKVPPGVYDQVRLVVNNGQVILKDGRDYSLKVPSGSTSGLKVFIDPPVQVTDKLSGDLLLDFDVSHSFVARGNINSSNGFNGFIFKPVVRASNHSIAGTLAGKVLSDHGTPGDDRDDLPLSGALVQITQDDEEITSGVTAADGTYKIIGLPAGTYDVTFSASGYADKKLPKVEVTVANEQTEDVTLEMTGDPTATTTNQP